MIKMNSSKKVPGDAYMLGRDGREIWVDVHPYGVVRKQSNTRECNLLPAVFLAENSRENRKEAIQFINSYLAEEVMKATDEEAEKLDNPEAIRKYLYNRLKRKPITFIQVLEWKGIVGDSEAAAQELVSFYDPKYFSNFDEAMDVDTRDLGIDLAYILNQEFIRIRVGGRYDSYGNGGYYARIGSTGFNWADLITDSVRRHHKKDNISFICIERDSESDTGDPFAKSEIYSYKTDSGTDIENLPIQQFLNEKISLASSVRYQDNTLENAIHRILSKSPSLNGLIKIRANRTRIFNRLGSMCLAERNGLMLHKTDKAE